MRKTSKSNKQQSSVGAENAMYYFATLMAVNTACYALCNILMIKIIEFQPVSLLLLIATLIVAFRSIAVRKKLYANFYTVVTLIGIVLCVLQALGRLPYVCLPVSTTLTADSLLFTATYIISDVFSEVFGYRASRMSNIIASVFALAVNYIAKSLTYVKGPAYAVENDNAFQFGLSNKCNLKCPKCGGAAWAYVPINDNYFRPTRENLTEWKRVLADSKSKVRPGKQ